MDNLIKVRDVTLKYDISARALKYYEEMGLLQSTKSDDYAYRVYDGNALKRLEQILILRKLNIKVKDIQRIFNSGRSDIVLEVLGQKIIDIDDEVALLYELKEIVLNFIRQIESLDFRKESDVKLLYKKANEIRRQISNVDYDGNPAATSRLAEITDKLGKKPDVRIVDLPRCRMVTSGLSREPDLFSPDGLLMRFSRMFSALDDKRKDKFFSRDFMWYDEAAGGMTWWYAVEEWVTQTDTDGFEFIDFEGGIYAAAICKDGDDADGKRAYDGIREWIDESGQFEIDERPGHLTMFHIPGSPASNKALGYSQLEIFCPIRAKK